VELPSILISNDDGLKGPGLRPLMKELAKIGKLYVIIPKNQMSGTGYSITLEKFKKVEKIEENFYVIKGGTPADCVKYGLCSFLKNKIDLVISSINTCPNVGQDIVYYGTVGATREIAEIVLREKIVPLGLRTYDENVKAVIDKKGNFSYKLSGYTLGG
jgi:5'-nucleotidase